MSDDLRAQLESSLVQLEVLKRRGRLLRTALADDPVDRSALPETRIWQQDCAAAINELSGGVKSHWLSRAYSGALLVRSTDGGALVEASVGEIVDRVLDVLDQAAVSLSQMDDVALGSAAAPPPLRRFEFVHDAALRPVLERAFIDSGEAFEEGDFTRSLMTSCGIIEAVITDALQHVHPRLEAGGWRLGHGEIAAWPFETRIAAAERAGLIRGGCARLTPVARAYRDADVIVTARDAKIARQVLHVVIRDLDPGR